MTKKINKKEVAPDVQAAIDKDNTSRPVKSLNDASPEVVGFDQISVDIWKPQPGEFVVGVYDGNIPFEHEKKKGNKEVLCHFIIDNDSGDRLSFIPGVMFDETIKQAKVKSGDEIFVAFKRQDMTNENNPVNVWDIRLKRK